MERKKLKNKTLHLCFDSVQ